MVIRLKLLIMGLFCTIPYDINFIIYSPSETPYVIDYRGGHPVVIVVVMVGRFSVRLTPQMMSKIIYSALANEMNKII